LLAGTPKPRHIAALLLARDKGVNFLKFASPADLATMQGIKDDILTSAKSSERAMSESGSPPTKRRKAATAKASKKKADAVFVVHGRDTNAREELSIFLRSLHVDVIEWTSSLLKNRYSSTP
jgi:predicted nucleotide-binding protein